MSFQPGAVYGVDPDGHIVSRTGARQGARMAGEAAAHDLAVEEAVAAGELDEATAGALEDAHQRRIGLELAQTQASAKCSAVAVEESLRTEVEAEDAVARQQEAKPVEPGPRFVRRGEWARVERARLKPGEKLYARWADGSCIVIGNVPLEGN